MTEHPFKQKLEGGQEHLQPDPKMHNQVEGKQGCQEV